MLANSHFPAICMSHLPQIIQSNYFSIFVRQKEAWLPERPAFLDCYGFFQRSRQRGNETIMRELVIVPHNLTNKFQPLDISINQSAKKFISNKFNAWYGDRVSKQLSNGVAPGNVKVSLKLKDLKPLHARWIVETYNHLKHQNDSFIKGFVDARISEAITFANDVFTQVENPFNEQRKQQNF